MVAPLVTLTRLTRLTDMRNVLLRFVVIALGATQSFSAQTPQQDAVKQTIAVLEQRLAQNPGDATWQYFLAVYYARAERKDDALAMLGKLAGRPTGLIADPETFASLAHDPRFAELAAQLEKSAPRVNRASVAFTIKQRNGEEILPEGMAYDEKEKHSFVGDAHQKRVYVVDAKGKVNTFAELPLIPLGMKVDRRRHALWVATYSGDFVPSEKK